MLCLTFLVAAAVDPGNDVGYNAMQVNYELLTKSIDPEDVLGSMFAHKLISFEEKKRIKRKQEQSGKRSACEEVLDTLFNNWKKGTCERFIQVLDSCDYKDCAAQLQSNAPQYKLICVDHCMICIQTFNSTIKL